jgi:hypothetical protein
MTFATEPVALREIYELPIVQPQFIPVLTVVAIEAPSHRVRVMELDIRVVIFKFPLFEVHLHRGMTIAAGKHPFCHRRRGNRKLFIGPYRQGGKANPHQE